MTTSPPPLLEGRNLTRTYRLGQTRVAALRGVDLAIRSDDFVVLEGPSGSGKTTLLNLLGLLDRPDEGTVSWKGSGLESFSEDARSDLRRDHFGYVFQSFNLIPVLTARENVEIPMVLRGVRAAERRTRALERLAAVGLADKQDVRPDLLSGGQRQRVAIARALANDAQVLVADEPTASLDSRTANEILDLMLRLHAERGVACVIAAHDPRVRARAKRVVALLDGRWDGGTA